MLKVIFLILVELFVNIEKTLLAKSDIDYKKADKENILENFTLKNLETNNELLNKNNITKSNILAPFNSSLKDSNEESYIFDLSYENNLIKLVGNVKEINHKYELENNPDFDNGVKKELNKKDLKSGISTPSELISNPISPPEFQSAKASNINTPRCESVNTNRNRANNSLVSNTIIIDDAVVKMVEKVGFNKDYLLKCLNYNELNHATSCYYIFSLHKQNDITEG